MTYTEPLLTVFLVIAFLGLGMLVRKKKPYSTCFVGLLGLLLISWPPMDWLLSRPLEAWYPVRPFRPAPVQAIVVLSSAVHPADFERPYPLADMETYERCAYAAWLHHQLQGLPVLACGGRHAPSEEPNSIFMRRLLEQSGVAPALIWTEERSRSTHENAQFGAQILKQHGISRIALVVDAQSMLRAAACFRREGIAVAPAPCSYRELEVISNELLPSWKAVRRNEITLHETLGIAWYWLHGWI